MRPTCRLHYGGILIAIGRWAEAEDELLAAIRVFESRLPRACAGPPLVRLAELRVRQGRFEVAERLLEGNESHPRRGVRAATALARGDLALAEELARVGLDDDEPSDPAPVPLLELLVEVRVAHGDLRRGEGGRHGSPVSPRPPRRATEAALSASSRRVGWAQPRATSGPHPTSGRP